MWGPRDDPRKDPKGKGLGKKGRVSGHARCHVSLEVCHEDQPGVEGKTAIALHSVPVRVKG